jgi:hypothetical protein
MGLLEAVLWLTFEIPEGNVDTSQRTHENWAAPVEAHTPGLLPDLFNLAASVSDLFRNS